MAGLTSKQRAFAKGVANGLPPASAARAAGYAEKSPHALQVQASRLTKHPEVQAAAHAEREKLISQTAHRALACLAAIIDNEAAQPAARVAASKWVLEAAGHGIESRRLEARIGDRDEVAPHRMSLETLEHAAGLAMQHVLEEREKAAQAAALDV